MIGSRTKPTAEQVAEFQKQVRQTAVSFADKAQEFIERFPTNENVGDARITVVHALSHAVAAGDAEAGEADCDVCLHSSGRQKHPGR